MLFFCKKQGILGKMLENNRRKTFLGNFMLKIKSIYNQIVREAYNIEPSLPQKYWPDFYKEWVDGGKTPNWDVFFKQLPKKMQPKAKQDIIKAQNSQKPQSQQQQQSAAQPATTQQVQTPQVPTSTQQQKGFSNLWGLLGNKPQQQQQTPATQISPQQQPVNATELATSLQSAIRGFGKAYNAQIKPYNESIKIINNIVQGLSSQSGAQFLQFNPQIGSQVQEIVTTLNNATQQEALDAQFISQLSQKVQSLSKIMQPQQQKARAASLILTPRIATASSIF